MRVRACVPVANHNVTAAPCLYKAAVLGIQGKNIYCEAACRLPSEQLWFGFKHIPPFSTDNLYR